MSNDFDDLMSRLDADPTMPNPGDLDTLITHYRQLRAAKESGTAPKKRAAGKPKPEPKPIDIAALGLVPKAELGAFKRRV